MTLNMKVGRKIFIFWFTVCVDWMMAEAGENGRTNNRLRLRLKAQHSRGFSKQARIWRPSNASVFNIKSAKRTIIQRRIQLKGAPKGVVVNVNGEKIYQSAGVTTASQPGQGAVGNKAINLHINLSKKPLEFTQPQRKQQPIIIAARPQQPKPVVIAVPAQSQYPPQQPVVMPATLPQPAPGTEKDENELGNILQTMALLNSLGKKEESPPTIIPVPVPAVGYPQTQGLSMGYPALQGYSPVGQNQGYPAGGNQGYPSQNLGYPAGTGSNQGYPAGGSQNQGYPAGGSQNQGYPAGYPATGNLNQGFPAGGGQNVLGAPAAGTTGASSLPGILPLILPMKCRCGCERRCPDLCGLCKDVDEEIFDSIDCCKSLPCPCLTGGASTAQQGAALQPAALQPAAVAPQQTTALSVPQNPQVSALPITPPITGQTQPAQISSPPLQPSVLGQTPPQPQSAPPLNPIPPASAPPLPSLTPGSVIPPSAKQPSTSGPALPLGSLPPLPPLPQITPPKPEAAVPKPEISPPKAAVAGTGPTGLVSGSILPPKPEIVPPLTNPLPEEESVPSLPSGPGDTKRPGESSSSIAPPPDNAGSIKVPQVPVLPGENENRPPPVEPPTPPLPSLPLTKSAYPAPPPPPQVFIIKENSASSKDPEDSKSAEALDNLSKTFQDAFTEAYTSERRKGRLQHESRRGSFRQRLRDQDVSYSDSNEPREGWFRQKQHEQDNSDTDSNQHHRERFGPRVPEEKPLDSNVDSEDENLGTNEDEEDEETMRSNVGSRKDFEDNNAADTNENSDDNQINDIIENALDNNDNSDDGDDDDEDDDGHDGHDSNNDHDDDDKALDVALNTEPSYDADEPRHSHPHHYHAHGDSASYRVEKEDNNVGYQSHNKGRGHHNNNHSQFRYSHKMSHRILEGRRVLSRSHRTKYPGLKSTKRKKLLRKPNFDSSHEENVQHTAPETIFQSNVLHKRKTKTVMNARHRLKIGVNNEKDKFKLSASHDKRHFAHLQNNSHGLHSYLHPVSRHRYNHNKHDHQRIHHKSYQNTLQTNRRKHLHPYSHANTGAKNHLDEISETSASAETSSGTEEETLATVKPEETVSSSGDGQNDYQPPAKNSDFEEHTNIFSKSNTRSFKVKVGHMLLKHKNLESRNSRIEGADFSWGVESGDDEISGTEGSNIY